MNLSYNAGKSWESAFLNGDMAFPAEYVIRIFKGSYPNLNLKKKSFVGKKICDIGCGDGRHFILLKQLGFSTFGLEITGGIVKKINSNLQNIGISKNNIKVGTNDKIPFKNEDFDYLLSWNACYYMGSIRDFGLYVKEFSRVLKPDGYLVLSIPKKTCFIYKGSKSLGNGYQMIMNDPFNIRNGEVLKMFDGNADIEKEFSVSFKNFAFGSIHDDCFGLDYHWHLVVCQKK